MGTQRGKAASKFEARSSRHEIHPPEAGENSNFRNPEDVNKSRVKAIMQIVVPLLALATCLYACAGKTASSKFYVLSSLPHSEPGDTGGKAIGVSPVALPDYLDRPQIVTRASENEMMIDEFSRWAEPLKENFYTVLVENLSALLNSEKIIKTIQNPGIPLNLQVGVEVVQFDGVLGGDVVLNARWGLFEAEGKKPLVIRRSLINEPTGAATYEALAAAESRAVAALSREIAESIRSGKWEISH